MYGSMGGAIILVAQKVILPKMSFWEFKMKQVLSSANKYVANAFVGPGSPRLIIMCPGPESAPKPMSWTQFHVMGPGP